MLVEVQALVDQSTIGNPRRVTLGLEGNRLNMLLAVLHRHGGISLGDQDVFANVVGGMRIQEPAADLPLLMAALSSLRSEARRVGKECVSSCRSRWWEYNYKKKLNKDKNREERRRIKN